jgi:hypothetical protein
MATLRVTNLKGRTGNQSPTLPDGVVVTGVATATSFSGALTGNVTGNADSATLATNAQGLTGTPNINVGVITATQYVVVPEGTNVLKAMLFT